MTDISSFGHADAERYADVLAQTVDAVANGGLAAGLAALQPIAGEVWVGRIAASRELGRSGSAPRARERNDALRAQVFVRDGFRCTYCGGRAVPRNILVAIHDLLPGQVPYDAHYARGKVHPVFWALAPEADHVVPHSHGGPNCLENLTTLHAACNTLKSSAFPSEVQFLPRPLVPMNWDGLIASYPALIDAGAGGVRPSYHRTWARRYAAPTT